MALTDVAKWRDRLLDPCCVRVPTRASAGPSSQPTAGRSTRLRPSARKGRDVVSARAPSVEPCRGVRVIAASRPLHDIGDGIVCNRA